MPSSAMGTKVILVFSSDAADADTLARDKQHLDDPFDGVEVFAIVQGDAAADIIADRLVEEHPGWKVLVC